MQNAGVFGKPTPAKGGGVAYSIASVLPAILAVVFILIAGAIREDFAKTNWYAYGAHIVSQLGFLCAVVWCFYFTKRPIKQVLQSQKCSPKYYLIAVILQIGLFALSELNTLFLEFLARFGYQPDSVLLPSMDGFGIVGVILVVALLPAICEELLFRGVVLDGLHAFGRVGAVLICGGMFALFHQNPAQTIYQFCCGAAFALVAIKSGSVLPTMLAHFLNNATILLMTKFGVTSFSTPVFVAVMCVTAICLVGSLAYLIFLDKKPTQKPMPEREIRAERKRFFSGASVGLFVCVLTWITALM